ncbi:uncharacterized protein I206_106934 [Kwoniella pini CBS 10737]|uniref:Uncharacterized protein n=1 Tax=Kwoniella pini CBS 10737 TaxID=1296096 RepID=A0A1B9HZP6_9TREE|nr:uncharacterized protein I206_05523 [Kwoniella pini CBS 10737]OCF48742.1 hypothetical protein I206_05523 [Kwoniella pini CBS 10737]
MSVAAELARVRLEPRARRIEESRSDTSGSVAESELESAPTDEDPDADNEYVVDAIKWAKYRDSTRDRSDGYTGWHYGVMWNGYLKTGSETEEPLRMFKGDKKGKYPLIDEFWNALGITIPPKKKEPMGTVGTVYECPPSLLRSWFKRNPTKRKGHFKYKRSYETYRRRRAKEIQREKLEREFKPVPEDLYTKKADSDYYLLKKRLRERRRLEKTMVTNSLSARPASGTSTRTPTPGPSNPVKSPPQPSLPVGSKVDKGKKKVRTDSPVSRAPSPPPTGKGKGKAQGFGNSSASKGKSKITSDVKFLGSPSSSLGSLFDSDKEDVEVDDALKASSEEEEEQIEEPVQQPLSSKRKANSPIASTSSSDKRAEKKARKEERTAKLATSKIAKRIISPPPSTPAATFGELQEGIFDAPPTPAASTSAASATASAIASASTAQPSTSAPATTEPDSAVSKPSSPVAPTKPVLSIQNVLAGLKAQQSAGPTNVQSLKTTSQTPAATEKSTTSSAAVRFAEEPKDPNLPTPIVKSPPTGPGKPNVPVSSTVVSDLAGPVAHFNPAPVASASTARAAPVINKPKYVQPSKIQLVDIPIKPVNERTERKAPTNPRGFNQKAPLASANLPARPTQTFVPRTNYPPQPYAPSAKNGNVPPTRSPITPQTPALPRVALAADPRRKPTAASNTVTNPPPTPISATIPKEPVNFSLKPVDVTGGLVTFSPSLLLKNPGKFVQVMRYCMTNPNWGAYLIPAAMEFFHRGLGINQLCPDSTTAFSVLIQFLSLDDQLRALSGAGITSGGGIHITACPPNPYAHQACQEWKLWIHDILQTTEYQQLVALCEKYDTQIAGPAVGLMLRNLDIGKIEDLQIDDLSGMRKRKNDIGNYSRFVYVSEDTRLPVDCIEFLTTDEFMRVLQKPSTIESNGNAQ